MEAFLDFTVFKFGKYELQVHSIVSILVLAISVFILLKIIKSFIYKSGKLDLAKKYAIYSLTKYFVYVFFLISGIQTLGFSLSVLIAGSAALFVGLGLGLQTLFSDFVSGIIILTDGSVKVNDVIEVNEIVGRVMEIKLRTTTVLTRDDKYIILPNSEFTKSKLINWTHHETASRFEVTIGVDYGSSPDQVMEIMKNAALEHNMVNREPEPFVRFEDCGDSALIFTLYFWSDEVFRVGNIKSDLRKEIFSVFRSQGVNIPFPQRVVHLRQ